MIIFPQSYWDRDPFTTYRMMNAEIDKDEKSGYLTPSEVKRYRNAANKCYLQAIRESHYRKKEQKP